jgi:hypothetical protein
MRQTDIVTRTTPDEKYVKYSLCLIKYHSWKTYSGVEAQLHAPDVSRQVHAPVALPPWRYLYTVCQNVKENRKTSYPYRELNSGCLAVHLIEF